jgi:hypothetical protein
MINNISFESFQILHQSIEFINNNQECNVDELPMELVNHWLISNPFAFWEVRENYRNSIQWLVFVYALDRGINNVIKVCKFDNNTLYKYYFKFHVLLGLRRMQGAGIKLYPTKIFNFKDYDNIEIDKLVLEDKNYITPLLSEESLRVSPWLWM